LQELPWQLFPGHWFVGQLFVWLWFGLQFVPCPCWLLPISPVTLPQALPKRFCNEFPPITRFCPADGVLHTILAAIEVIGIAAETASAAAKP
jgi:hypothetical protein